MATDALIYWFWIVWFYVLSALFIIASLDEENEHNQITVGIAWTTIGIYFFLLGASYV